MDPGSIPGERIFALGLTKQPYMCGQKVLLSCLPLQTGHQDIVLFVLEPHPRNLHQG